MSDWIIRKAARLLQPGERFVFTEDLGGEGETLTVVSVTEVHTVAVIETEELDFDIEVLAKRWVEVVE